MLKRFLDLKAHDEWLQTILVNLHEAVVISDIEGGVTFMNAAAQVITGWEPTAAQGRAVEEVIRLVASCDIHSRLRGAVAVVWQTDQSVDLTGHYLWRAHDGTVLPIDGRVTVMHDGTGNLIGAVWVFHDATAVQQFAARLQAVLRKQEILLREVHHRIKNNFQTIVSLLDLHAEVIEDPRAVAALGESQQRLQAMALVHESLYQSQHLDRMDGAAYLHSLVTALGRAYAVEARHLTLTITADTVELRAEAALPYGLILTELLTNALKHAFPAGRPGAIEVTLHGSPGGTCVLTVCDDGVGFPAGLDFRQATSYGLHLVRLLTEQLGGTLEMTRDHGTHWRLMFPMASS